MLIMVTFHHELAHFLRKPDNPSSSKPTEAKTEAEAETATAVTSAHLPCSWARVSKSNW